MAKKEQQPDDEPRTMRFRETLSSVLFGALGVQSSKARERDFTKGKPSHFIGLGIAFLVVFVLVILGVVSLVLHFAGV
ncbi:MULTISPECIES: DUF2970 domain-containing protein [Pseudomonas]|nr:MULTISPECIES: DUF2970 domain-containing protein [Pseudomonas]QIB52471.1 DUF2970 domain-containing protein [Pseudomonas sp. OIL-1]